MKEPARVKEGTAELPPTRTGAVPPPANGPRYGAYGGAYIPETLVPAVRELEAAYEQARAGAAFGEELRGLLREYAGRPTPLTLAHRLSSDLGGARIYLKREDLAHTGAHKINNALGQALLARRMGKQRVVAETGAGQHGVATATVCALMGLECVGYMGTTDMARQQLNVFRMRLLGAKVRPVDSGSCTLKDAINEAIRDWVTNVHTTHYLLGSALGPHPYPRLVRDFQRVIGDEAREQILAAEDRLPDLLVACVGGGSNAIGLFHPFLQDEAVAFVGVEAGGEGIETGRHAARFATPSTGSGQVPSTGSGQVPSTGRLGVIHGTQTYVLQDPDGQIAPTHSISAGLDYAAIGPEHAWLRDNGRAEYTYATDAEALAALQRLSELEGIIPALESAHAVAETIKRAPKMSPEQVMIVNLSGRGDKDMPAVAAALRAGAESSSCS